jgi:hypothetical protein
MNRQKEPLYRKVNTKALHHHHQVGNDARHDRNTKKGISEKMSQGAKRGLDYTPLFRFLQSRVGQDFDKVYSEAISRLDQEDPIFWIVIRPEYEQKSNIGKIEHVRLENAIFSALYVDENNILQYITPNLKNEQFAPSCPCCTHTFNGKPLIRKYLNSDNTFDMPANVTRV